MTTREAAKLLHSIQCMGARADDPYCDGEQHTRSATYRAAGRRITQADNIATGLHDEICLDHTGSNGCPQRAKHIDQLRKWLTKERAA